MIICQLRRDARLLPASEVRNGALDRGLRVRDITQTIRFLRTVIHCFFFNFNAFLQTWRGSQNNNKRHGEKGIGRTKISFDQSVVVMRIQEVMVITKAL